MKEIVADEKLVACCGLYCGACQLYIWGKCPGCMKNERASWCKVRSCCIEHNYTTCADCEIIDYFSNCSKLTNPVTKIIGFLLDTNRIACLIRIKKIGCAAYAKNMSETRRVFLRK
ncbi:MAG: DUF3795 domain-containing protein [Nitrospirae bacterium]|nr:DUF3795 domain-containing protein [Nitrospirota bacterium]